MSSFSKHIQRMLALLLITCMLLTGCNQPNKNNKETQDSSSVSAKSELEALPESQQLQSIPTKAPGDNSVKKYTLMVYMVGSDLESGHGCATKDIQEMLDSGLDFSKVNLVIYTGGSKYWNMDIPSDCNTVLYISSNGKLEVAAATSEPANMGDPSTLLDFMNYTYQNFQAEKYSMICWNHGGGPLCGYGVDELFDADRLYLQEMESAFAASPFAQQKMEFLGFDACLMGTIEAAEMADDYFHYMIASEEVELASGWDYSFLKKLNSTTDTKAIADEILTGFDKTMKAYNWKVEYTLSCLDLSHMDATVKAMDTLFLKMAESVKNGGYSKLAKIREKLLRFGTSGADYDQVDLGHMVQSLSSDFRSETATMQTQLNSLIYDQVTSMTGASGVSIYFPYDNKDWYQGWGYYFHEDLSDSTGYESFIDAFTDVWINGEPEVDWSEHQVHAEETPTPDTTPTVPDTPGNTPEPEPQPQPNADLSLQLSQSQLNSLSKATYTIFSYSVDSATGKSVFTPVLKNCPIEPDSKGVIRLPDKQEVIILRTDEENEGTIWPVSAVSSSEDTPHYITSDTYLTTTLDIIDGVEEIAIFFSESGSSNEMNILSMITLNGSDTIGRSQPQTEYWDYIAKNYTSLFPTYNAAGVLLPYYLWDDNGVDSYSMISYAQDFWLEKEAVSELEGDFYYQFILEDTQGNSYASELARFPKAQTYEEIVQDDMTFYVYDDHAELVEYSGKSSSVAIPNKINGVDVTVIRPYAFYYNYNITTVSLPEKLEEIGTSAFANCKNLTSVVFMGGTKVIRSSAFYRSGLIYAALPKNLERIESLAFAGTSLSMVDIPANVSYIGSGAFADTQLVGIMVNGQIEGNNGYFKTTLTGMLLTADGKELVQAPLGASIRLTVPDGVEVIRASAVRGGNRLVEVNLPDSLKIIDSYAFYDTVNLEAINLPDKLEIIGHSAFSTFGVDSNAASPVTTVTIGPNVRWIGYNAFDGYPISNFQVSASNQYFSSVNGSLLNKSGTVFLHAPYTLQGKLEIPNGVSHIAFHALYKCDGITELILPDSVVSMDAQIGLPDSLTKLSVGKGLNRWDNIADTHYIKTVEISTSNPNYIMLMDSIFSKDFKTLHAFREKGDYFMVPDGVVEIADQAFCPDADYNTTLEHIYFPASITYLNGDMFKNLRGLKIIDVAADNQNYATYDGLLYTKNGVSLIACPQGLTGSVTVREGTITIWEYAFGSNLQATEVHMPGSLSTIRKGNFTNRFVKDPLQLYLPASLTEIYPRMLSSRTSYVVHCPAGSAADSFARARGVEVVN